MTSSKIKSSSLQSSANHSSSHSLAINTASQQQQQQQRSSSSSPIFTSTLASSTVDHSTQDYSLSNAIQFEIVIFVYLMVQLFIQYYHIYRMNFYNYDFFVLLFSMTIIVLRFVWRYTQYVYKSNWTMRSILPCSVRTHVDSTATTSATTTHHQRQPSPSSSSSSSTNQTTGKKSKSLNVDRTTALAQNNNENGSSVTNNNNNNNSGGSSSNNNNNGSSSSSSQFTISLMKKLVQLIKSTFESWQRICLCLLLMLLSGSLMWLSMHILVSYSLFRFIYILIPLFFYGFVFYGVRTRYTSQYECYHPHSHHHYPHSHHHHSSNHSHHNCSCHNVAVVASDDQMSSNNSNNNSGRSMTQQRKGHPSPSSSNNNKMLLSANSSTTTSLNTNSSSSSSNSGTSANTTAIRLEQLNAQPVYQLKLLIYCTFEAAYYTTILPLGFVGSHIYYERLKSISQIFFVLANMFVLLALQLLSANFFRFVCHKHTFGCWKERSASSQTDEKIKNWSPKHRASYKKGQVIRYQDHVYVAEGAHQNCGVPGDLPDEIVHTLFYRPERLFSYLIFFQGLVTVFQLVVFIRRWTSLATTAHLSKESGGMDGGGIIRSIISQILLLGSRWDFQWDIYLLTLLFHYYIFYLCVLLRREILKKTK